MAQKYKGKYKVRNPEMYKGDLNTVEYRSNWEKQCFLWLDGNKDVEWWSSEEFVVPYYYDVDKKMHRYFVDLSIRWKNGKLHLIEVKPKKQTQPPKTKRPKSKASLNEAYTWIKNQNKWEAADKIAKDNGWEFLIWTEEELERFGILKKQPGKMKKLKPMRPYRKKKST
jgi:hypothetical protein